MSNNGQSFGQKWQQHKPDMGEKKIVDNHDVAVHREGDLFFIIDTQI